MFDFFELFYITITFIAFLPMLLIPFVVIIKIMMGKSLSNSSFYSCLILLLALSGITVSIIFYMGQPTLYDDVSIPFMHRINGPLGTITTLYCSMLNIYLLIFYVILLIYCIKKYVKSKDIKLLKRFGISSLLVIILFVFGLPTLYCPIYYTSDYESYTTPFYSQIEIKKLKIAEKLSILPAMKAFYSDLTALLINRYLFNKYQENLIIPDFSSKEAQDLIDEYIKYQEYSAKTKNYSEYALLSGMCLNYERFDEALTYVQIAQKYGYNAQYLTSAIYIAKGEYQKALESLNPNDKFFATQKKLIAIYIGLENFDKAENIIKGIEENKITKHVILEAKIYLNYKKGDIKKAKELFENYKQNNRKFKKYSFEEFVKYLDRINY